MRQVSLVAGWALVLAACGGGPAVPNGVAAPSGAAAPSAAAAVTADFLRMPLRDVRTGELFTLADRPGRPTLVQAMAVW